MRVPNLVLNAARYSKGTDIDKLQTANVFPLGCGNSIAPTATSIPTGGCQMVCGGNQTEACGGPDQLNIFWSGHTGPQTNPGPGLWSFVGCYT